jgi:hypothetical protein
MGPHELSRRVFVASMASVALAKAGPPRAHQQHPLFFIARSKNANVVQYDAIEKAEHQLDPSQPVVAYWVIRAEDGRREELSLLDRRAYGFRVVPERSDAWLLYLNAVPTRAIRVLSWQGRWVAQMVISTVSAVLLRIYVTTDEGGFYPRVRSIEVFGTNMITGRPVSERLT